MGGGVREKKKSNYANVIRNTDFPWVGEGVCKYKISKNSTVLLLI